jgi:hypothetical protein
MTINTDQYKNVHLRPMQKTKQKEASNDLFHDYQPKKVSFILLMTPVSSGHSIP